MKKLPFFLLLVSVVTVRAQNHPHAWLWDTINVSYLSVDPATGNESVIGTVPGLTDVVPRSGFLTGNGDFCFIGYDVNYTSYLYTLNGSTGAVVSNPQLTYELYAPHYNCNDNQYYALGVDFWASGFNFIRFDPQTAQRTILNSQSLQLSIGPDMSTIDPVTNHYVLVGYDSLVRRIFSFDLQNGSIVSNPTYTGDYYCVNYYTGDSTMYALWRQTQNSPLYIVTFDPQTAAQSVIAPVPGLDNMYYSSCTIDQQNGLFIFKGADTSGTMRLYTFDLQADTFLYNSPTGYYSQDLRLSSCSGIQGIAEEETSSLQVYPNPTTGLLHLPVSGSVHIFNTLGQEVMSMDNKGEVLSVAALPPGLYRLIVETPGGFSGVSFVKE